MDINDFEQHRPDLFGLAYRMLGSAAEAEDVVQDAWLRSAGAETSDIRSPRAYLMTVVTRLAGSPEIGPRHPGAVRRSVAAGAGTH